MSEYNFLDHLELPKPVYQNVGVSAASDNLGSCIRSAMKQANYIDDECGPEAKELADFVDEIDTYHSVVASSVEEVDDYIAHLEDLVDQYQSELEYRLTDVERKEIEEEQIFRKLQGK